MANYTNSQNVDLVVTTVTALSLSGGSVPLSMSSGGATDVESPLVHFETTPGTPISKTSELALTITDETAIGQYLITVRFASGGAFEVAWDGSSFADTYSGSSVAPISGGFRFVLRRNGGWFLTPTIRVFVVDSSGNLGVNA